MAAVKDIYHFLDERAPFDSQLGFDNAGFLVGRGDQPVTRVLVALDITEEVAREATAVGAELIVSHHPVIWEGAKSVTDETLLGRKLLALITGNIAAICAHTNLDAARSGVNDALAAALGLTETALLKTYGVYADGTPYGIERVGTLPGGPVFLEEFAVAVKEKLGSNGVRYVDGGRPVRSTPWMDMTHGVERLFGNRQNIGGRCMRSAPLCVRSRRSPESGRRADRA